MQLLLKIRKSYLQYKLFSGLDGWYKTLNPTVTIYLRKVAVQVLF